MDIITRFDLTTQDLVGRVYVFSHNFRESYRDVEGAMAHMQDVTKSPELDVAKRKKFGIVHAIMWGGDEDDHAKMIDFFGIGANNYFKTNWPGNPEILSWVTRNGVLVPKEPISEVTCGNGWHIIDAEEQYRRTRPQDGSYVSFPPTIEGLTYLEGDRCTPKPRTRSTSYGG